MCPGVTSERDAHGDACGFLGGSFLVDCWLVVAEEERDVDAAVLIIRAATGDIYAVAQPGNISW
jgi:hypothetical protein